MVGTLGPQPGFAGQGTPFLWPFGSTSSSFLHKRTKSILFWLAKFMMLGCFLYTAYHHFALKSASHVMVIHSGNYFIFPTLLPSLLSSTAPFSISTPKKLVVWWTQILSSWCYWPLFTRRPKLTVH